MDTGETSSAKPNKLMHRNRNQQQDDKPRREHPPKTHSFNKRPVSKPFQRKCDIYVSNKSNFQVISQKFVIVIIPTWRTNCSLFLFVQTK